jgi:prepilin-type N-terminal cleavage/methylation domain-containing protein
MMGRDREGGFTLTELVVVLSLLSMILAVAYAGFQVTFQGSKISDRQAWTSREVAAPLEFAERTLTQQFGWDSAFPGATPYRCAYYTDADNDGKRERYVIESTTDGRLLVTLSEEVDNPTARTTAWSTANFNRAAGIPLVRYYNSAGTEITTMSQVYSNVRQVTVTIVTEYDGQRFSDSRRIFFRN